MSRIAIRPERKRVTAGISRRPAAGASTLLLLLACGGGGGPASAPAPAPADTSAARTVPLHDLFVLESWGTPPADTALTVIAGSDRSVILRHAPPDNAVFAELRFPAGAFAVQPGTPVRVEVRPRPGVYGLTLATDVPVGEGATITFSYPMHFLAPAEARRRFGGDFAYERALQIGRLTDDRVSLLPSTRPASDYLRAPLPAAGTYVVGAAPR